MWPSKIGRGNNDGDNQRIYIPLTTMMEFFPMTGDNIPQDSIYFDSVSAADRGSERDGEGRGASHRCSAAWIRSVCEGGL